MAYPYNNYVYGGYNQPMFNQQPNTYQYQQQIPQYQGYNQPTMQPQITPTQNYIPTFISGIEGAKGYIVMPNQTVWLQDSEHENILYVKSADNQGKFTLNAFKMQPIQIEDIGKKPDEIKPQAITPNIDMSMFATKSDLDMYLGSFSQKIDNLSSKLEKALETQPNKRSAYYNTNANTKRSE